MTSVAVVLDECMSALGVAVREKRSGLRHAACGDWFDRLSAAPP